MNAAVSTPDFIQENASESDSDSNAGDAPEYYLPISSVAGDDDEEDVYSDHSSDNDHHQNHNFHPLSNGCVENGIASLDLTDDEEEDMTIVSSDSAIQRAFREDESRRNAPLPPENATRVMEAMRGISFGGMAPDWAGRVREDMWIDQLRNIRQSFSSTTTANRPA